MPRAKHKCCPCFLIFCGRCWPGRRRRALWTRCPEYKGFTLCSNWLWRPHISLPPWWRRGRLNWWRRILRGSFLPFIWCCFDPGRRQPVPRDGLNASSWALDWTAPPVDRVIGNGGDKRITCSRPWPPRRRWRGFRGWQWPWRFLFVLFCAVEDRNCCIEVVGFVTSRAFFVAVVRYTAESVFAAAVDHFCPV